MPDVLVVEADLENPRHQRAVVAMVNTYARDPMGRGQDLPEEVLRDLVPGLQRHPTSLIFLAFDDEVPVGVAVSFVGFSTFAARPLINIHDLAVAPGFRGRGIGRQLPEQVEARARALGCCKLTLEVAAENTLAQELYRTVGFRNIDAGGGGARMWFLEKRF